MANVEGKATAITVLTPVRRGGPLLLWLVFWAGRNITETLKKLQQLSFIHYARWAVIERFPDQGEGERLQSQLPAVREQLQRHLGPVHRRVLRSRAHFG